MDKDVTCTIIYEDDEYKAIMLENYTSNGDGRFYIVHRKVDTCTLTVMSTMYRSNLNDFLKNRGITI